MSAESCELRGHVGLVLVSVNGTPVRALGDVRAATSSTDAVQLALVPLKHVGVPLKAAAGGPGGAEAGGAHGINKQRLEDEDGMACDVIATLTRNDGEQDTPGDEQEQEPPPLPVESKAAKGEEQTPALDTQATGEDRLRTVLTRFGLQQYTGLIRGRPNWMRSDGRGAAVAVVAAAVAAARRGAQRRPPHPLSEQG
eukprot:gene23278-biopygen54353